MPDVFQLLADPTRRRLLEALRGGERAVNDLVDDVEVSQPAVSKQLRILKEGGMVEVRREGRQRRYSIRGEPLLEATRWLGFYAQFWAPRIDKMDRLLAAGNPPRRRKMA